MNTLTREHRWTIAEPPDSDTVARLSKEINLPIPLARILVSRGINDYDKAKAYFRPTLALLHDPFLMDGMEMASSRILRAIDQQEKMRIFGDYDVDGTSGTSMLYLFLKEIGANVSFYIPERIKEGYGISQTGIDRAHEDGATLFIAVDCGITAVEQVMYAKKLGLDVIICDHHEPGDTLPEAYAVLDPIKPGDAYPFKNLSGCGVAFKLIHAIAIKTERAALLPEYLEFNALASTADIVPLVGENRVIVKIGLERLNANPRPGIKALIECAGFTCGQIATGQIVFGLAPRINAAGRLGDATRAVRLLTCADLDEAGALAQVLEEENLNRRKIDGDTFLEAQTLADALLGNEAQYALVLHQEHWHPGVVGIVASRMVERYYKPSIMMATVDGVAKGSARSVAGFNIYDALKKCETSLIQFGGHKYAAGLTVELSKVDEFRMAFNAAVQELITEDLMVPELRIDGEISLNEVTPRFARLLKEFAPFGPSNMRPVFVARDLELVGTPRVVGKNHLRFKVRQNDSVIDAIGFGLGDMIDKLQPGRKGIECVFTVEENTWGLPQNGTSRNNNQPSGRQPTPQLKIRDFK